MREDNDISSGYLLKGEIRMEIIHVTEANFEQEILQAKCPVVVDFWADWCAPCRMASPIIEELSEEISEVKFCKVDVDRESELANQYHISSIPCFMLFKEGEVVGDMVGLQSKEVMRTFCKR